MIMRTPRGRNALDPHHGHALTMKRNQMETDSTKLKSYYATLAADIGGRRGQVLKAITKAGSVTRHGLVHRAGLPLQTICGRVSELLEMGVIVVSGLKYESETRRECETLSIPKKEVLPKPIGKKSRIADDIKKLQKKLDKTQCTPEEESMIADFARRLSVDYPYF